jgi:hypothetical protein
MAIQFACPSCRQPIEIDDDHGGRQVSCPYCQNVVSAPTVSTLDPMAGPESASRPEARPLSPNPAGATGRVGPYPAGTGPHPMPISAPAHPAPRNTIGLAGAICGVFAVILYFATISILVSHQDELGFDVEGQVDEAEMQKRIMELSQDLEKNPWVFNMLLCFMGCGLCWLTGLICSIVGMSKRYRRHAPAIVGLILSFGLVVISCSGFVLG